MRRSFILVSAFTVFLANALQTVAIYQCSMTGKRTWMRCCCAPASAAMGSRTALRGGCGQCASIDRESRKPGSLTGPMLRGMGPRRMGGLTRPCCKLTQDKATPQTLPDAASSDGGWKKALSDGRLLLAGLPPVLPGVALPSLERFLPGAESGSERSAPPLFLLHCSFLI